MKISLLIPAYNEEKTIARCIEACLSQTRRLDEIIVVNDSSTDDTANILRSFGKTITVLKTPQNGGNKSYAQEFGMKFVTGDVVVMTDADTIIAPDFVERVESIFVNNAEVHAVAGYIKSMKHNWITACRELDYIVGQDLHKSAQAKINSILVIPGCAAAFRVKTFRKYITFDHDTVTEDLDFTYKLHQNNLQIHFDRKAIVYTQDPSSLSAYINQMRRWIGGGWQNAAKHWKLIASRPGHALEISLMYFEGIIFGLLFFVLPLISIIFFTRILIGYFILATFIGIYGSLHRKRYDLLFYAPLLPLVQTLNSYLLFEQFVKEIVLKKRTLTWHKPERRLIK